MKTASLHEQGAWVQSYFSTEYIEVFATDGEVYKFRGSLIADFKVDGVDLSHMVREALGMDDLYVFDGNNKPDRVDTTSLTQEDVALPTSCAPGNYIVSVS